MEQDTRPKWGQGCSKGCLVPQRVVITLMGFFGFICAFTNRVSLSHVITKLVKPLNRTMDEVKEEVCPKEVVSSSDQGYNKEGVYDWSEQMQGFVLGSFYFGYLITHLPGGILADRYGAKWVLGICLLISGLATGFSPLAIEYGEAYGLLAIRVIMGGAQGPLFPAATALLSAWIPAKERGMLATFCYSGVTFGTVISNIFSGLMLHYYHWSVTLIVFGSITVIWFILFALICYSTPGDHPCIKPKETAYLKEEIGSRTKAELTCQIWKDMMLNKVMWAVIVSQIGHDWGYFVMITCLPKYIADVLQMSIRSNGFVTALPFIAMWCCNVACGFLADIIIRKGWLSITTERKIFTFIAALGPGAFTVIASYAGCDKTLVVIFFVIAMFWMGTYYAGQKLSPMDMSPTYSGTITAITNGLGSLAGMASPPIVGFLTPNATMNEWRVVFWLGLVILVISAIVFAIWGSAEIQPYDPKYTGKKDEKA